MTVEPNVVGVSAACLSVYGHTKVLLLPNFQIRSYLTFS